MARPGITESEVFTTIETLLNREAKITVESIRAELQRGSPNTINRHLRVWREQQELERSGDNNHKIKKLREQNLSLQHAVTQYQQQLQSLTAKILDKDLKNQQISKELQAITIERNILTQKVQQAQFMSAKSKELYTETIIQKENTLNAIIAAQTAQAEQFSKDLQAINQASLQSVREIGFVGQDLLIAEKLKTKELDLKITELQAQLVKSQQLLEQTKNQQLPLQKRLKQQEQLIANCLDPNKVTDFKRVTETEI